ncbi:TetR/AcrR family transcriptional regulator [Lacisediminihabitans changchengi]|uniref:TetR/AcrR family transcriptional regulator n=1 Tax=Lacisediminihabitans changchengi TaxID=2787634 RepID=A0A934SJA1_9MICO|nr:TetR/AcrR family transcriptional regulator [Lacisediminihabitans changchengi]MBK4347722.1 TetR/AcrR family transcriptional regulator [Lacisediminihabitans changchengi]
MPDPRIQRTRDHVLATVRKLLAEPASTPLTFTILAAEAQVSRRTLYTHWGSIDRVISDAVSSTFAGDASDFDGLTTFERLNHFLVQVRDTMCDPVFAATVTMQMAKATRDPEAADSLREMNDAAIAEFRERVAPVTTQQYGAIVGPVFFAQLIARVPMTDVDVRNHAEIIAQHLGLMEAVV